MPSPLRALIGLLLLTATLHAQSPDPATLLTNLASHYQLHAEGVRPWHLKATLQIFATKTTPGQTAIIEEFYVNSHKSLRTITMPGFSQKRIINADGEFTDGTSGSLPYLVHFAYYQIFSPEPSAQDIATSHPTASLTPFGKIKLNCIMLAQNFTFTPRGQLVQPPPQGLFPTYCLEPDTHALRASTSFGNTFVVFNKVGAFLGSEIPILLTITSDNVKAAELTVNTMQTMPTIDDSLFVVTPTATTSHDGEVRVAGGVTAGNIISKVVPVYPDVAKQQHAQGAVRLRAIISTDGRIRDLRIIEAPTAELAISALAAVSKWTYKPYLLAGVPTEVDTTITVNFNFGN